jgi:redox-sensing transcriptional repressor
MSYRQIPDESIGRLFSYLRALLCLAEEDRETVSSQELAEACDVKSTIVRKDISHFGRFGTRGVGYQVDELIEAIRGILNLETPIKAALVGVGNIGRALLAYPGFSEEGFQIVAAFDQDPEIIGQAVGDVVVEDSANLESRIREEGIQLGIVAVDVSEAPAVGRRLADSGVEAILSFAPCSLNMPDNVKVTCVDLAMELARLVYHL